MFINKYILIVATTFAALGMQPAHASSVTYSFDRITNTADINVGGQLKMKLEDVTGGVLFTFSNNVTSKTPASIANIYFDDADPRLFINPISIAINGQSGGVIFSDNPDIEITEGGKSKTTYTIDETKDNLPSGNNLDPDFVANDSASVYKANANGVDRAGEWISFLGLWAGNSSLNDLIAKIDSGDFRVGLHVRSIGQSGKSDSYITNPPAVPLPAAAWLFGSALIGFVTLSNRRKV